MANDDAQPTTDYTYAAQGDGVHVTARRGNITALAQAPKAREAKRLVDELLAELEELEQ